MIDSNPMHHAGYSPIRDYGLIGDGRAAALVSRSGSVDWLCWPRFDSPSLFGSILDAEEGGRFSVCPRGPWEATRRYLRGTNVLETTFRAAGGVLRLTDAMAVEAHSERKKSLLPDHELLRRVECVEGSVEVEVTFDPRPDYGRTRPRLWFDPALVATLCEGPGQIYALQSDLHLPIASSGPGARTRSVMEAGDRVWFSLTCEPGPAVVGGLGDAAAHRLDRTVRWWESWSDALAYEGPYCDQVIRSVLLLKLLIYSPSGAIIAAPTTSLPERIGKGDNWDYRYCWLRDASMTLRALFDLELIDEGEAFLNWLLQATRLTWPRLQVLYNVYGESHVKEKELGHLAGYRDSRPVRVGNQASEQQQLDVYGEVIAAVADYVRRGGSLDRSEIRMVRGLGESMRELWQERDAGIWESRGGGREHTLSRAMCWVGIDGLITMGEAGIMEVPLEAYRQLKDEIESVIESRGWNPILESYTATLDGSETDASLLLLGLYGYRSPEHPRMKSTQERIRRRLGVDGFLYRFPQDDRDSAEGVFGICTFWEADFLARQGRIDEARSLFERALKTGNDLGLFSEESDPSTGDALGNFPQAFSHVGLINAAVAIGRGGEGPGAPADTKGHHLRERNLSPRGGDETW